MDTISREVTLSKLICFPSEKGSSLKGKTLLPRGANSFFLEKIPFQKWLGVQESKQEVSKIVSLVKRGQKLPSVLSPLRWKFEESDKSNHNNYFVDSLCTPSKIDLLKGDWFKRLIPLPFKHLKQ